MAKPKAVRKRPKSDFWIAIPFILPALLGLGIFVVFPGLRGIYLSFTEYNIFREPEFIGLENYEKLVQDPIVWNALAVTLQYVIINIGFQTILALFVAVLLHRFTRSVIIRGVILVPYLISNVIVALVFWWLLDYNLGYINSVIEFFDAEKITFFGHSLAMPTIAMINVWRHFGYTALLIFAGLQAIPKDIYDAADVDGASEWRTFRSITALFGHAGIEWDITETSAEERKHLKSWTEFYKTNRGLIHSGKMIRVEQKDDTTFVHGVVAQDQSKGLFAYVQLRPSGGTKPAAFCLEGLDPIARYRVRLEEPAGKALYMQQQVPKWMEGVVLTGAALARIGLRPPILAPENAILVSVERIK